MSSDSAVRMARRFPSLPRWIETLLCTCRSGERSGESPLAALERELAEITAQVERAPAARHAMRLNRAGDICAEIGETARALAYYGRAIDESLEQGRWDAAEVLCRKILRVSPTSVRPHRTLAWIAIGKGYLRDAEGPLQLYVDTSLKSGAGTRAAGNLRAMMEVIRDPDLLERVGKHLLALGDEVGARKASMAAVAARNASRAQDQAHLWREVLRAVLTDPDGLPEVQPECEIFLAVPEDPDDPKSSGAPEGRAQSI